MSTSISRVDGMLVVTQLFPQDPHIPGPGTGPNPNPNPGPGPARVPVRTKLPWMTEQFLRGEPQALGVVQIFIGSLSLLFLFSFFLSPTMWVQLPLLGGAAFVVSGSVAVASRRGTSAALIKASLALHVLSSVVALVLVVYHCWLLVVQPSWAELCSLGGSSAQETGSGICLQMIRRLEGIMIGVWILLLLLFILQFAVSIALSVFSARATCHGSTDITMVCDSRVGLLDETEYDHAPGP